LCPWLAQPVQKTKELGFEFWKGQEFFLFSKNVQNGSGTHAGSYSMGIEDSFSGVR